MSQTIAGLGVDRLALVHVTDFMPNEDDNTPLIQSRFNAMGGVSAFDNGDMNYLRNTVHFTLNHPVESHMMGEWDDKDIIIIAPLQDVMEANGNPTCFNTVDTFWATAENAPVRMKNGVIIMPSNDLPQNQMVSQRAGSNKIIYRKITSIEDAPALIEHLREADYTFVNRTKNLLDEFVSAFQNEFRHKWSEKLIADITPDNILEFALAMPEEFQQDFLSAAQSYIRKSATFSALNAIDAPVMPGGMWSWADDWNATCDSKLFAQELGSLSEAHSNTSYSTIADCLHSKEVEAVESFIQEDDGINDQTKEIARSILAHPNYQKWVKDNAPSKNATTAQPEYEMHSYVLADAYERLKTIRDKLESKHERYEQKIAAHIKSTKPCRTHFTETYIASSEEHKALNRAYERQNSLRQDMSETRAHLASLKRLPFLKKAFDKAVKESIASTRNNYTALSKSLTEAYAVSAEKSRKLEAVKEQLRKEAQESFEQEALAYEKTVAEQKMDKQVFDVIQKILETLDTKLEQLNSWRRDVGEDHVIGCSDKDLDMVIAHALHDADMHEYRQSRDSQLVCAL